MKNTTKLKNILQLYSVCIDADDEGNFLFSLVDKANGEMLQFCDKSYTVVIAKAFSSLKKRLRESEKLPLKTGR